MIPKQFEIDGVRYVTDEWGVVHQDPPEITQVYDQAYVEKRYDTLPDHGRQMSFLRIGYLLGTLRNFQTVLDVGYGNGDFLATLHLWKAWHVECWGLDVSGYPLPDGCRAASREDLCGKSWDLVTFFDSFEHVAELGFISQMKARNIAITVPFCHVESMGLDWFRTWKHRRPGEHLHHFSKTSLVRFLFSQGYQVMAWQALEDGIRQPANGQENTFTAIFQRQ
jgi:hypothetical protein